MHEIDEDHRWEHSTELYFNKLPGWIAEVLQADDRGECEPLEPEQLFED